MSEITDYQSFGVAIDVNAIATECIDYAIKAKEQDPNLDLPSLTELSVAREILTIGATAISELMDQKGEDVKFIDFFNKFEELGDEAE